MTEVKITYDLNLADTRFKDEVAALKGGENIKRCFGCGACSARCPIGALDPEFDPRRFIRMIILGLRDQALDSIHLWRCATCFSCQETCPQGVGFTDVLFVLKNLAAKAGRFPAALSAQPKLLMEHGRLYEIGEFENEKRADLGLPPLEEKPEHFRLMLKSFSVTPKEDGP